MGMGVNAKANLIWVNAHLEKYLKRFLNVKALRRIMVEIKKFPSPPGGHAVAEQHVADDVPPHQPLPLFLPSQETNRGSIK